jgi:hypothetical protein
MLMLPRRIRKPHDPSWCIAGLYPGMSSDNTTAIRLSAGDYAFHRQEAIRLRALAKAATTAAVKARLLQKAEDHARLAGLTTYHWTS